MHSPPLAGAVPNGSIHSVEPSPNYTIVRKSKVAEPCIIWRISQWLWSPWTVDRSKVSDGLLGPVHLPTDVDYASRSGEANNSAITAPTKEPPEIAATHVEDNGLRVQKQHHEDTPAALPCRACRALGMTCDLQKPRCSHCLDQQVLCFYVAPLRLSMKRSKKSRSSRPESTISSAHRGNN